MGEGKQSDRQTDRQADKMADRQTDRLTSKHLIGVPLILWNFVKIRGERMYKIRKKMNLCSGVPLAVSKEGARKGRRGGRRKGGSERQHKKEAEACKANEGTRV